MPQQPTQALKGRNLPNHAEIASVLAGHYFVRTADRLPINIDPASGQATLLRACDEIGASVTIANILHAMLPTIHFTIDRMVDDHFWGSWSDAPYALVLPADSTFQYNGLPVHMHPLDTWWGEAMIIPPGSILYAKAGSLDSALSNTLANANISVIEIPEDCLLRNYVKGELKQLISDKRDDDYCTAGNLYKKVRKLAPGQMYPKSIEGGHSLSAEIILRHSIIELATYLYIFQAIRTKDDTFFDDEKWLNSAKRRFRKFLPPEHMDDVTGKAEIKRLLTEALSGGTDVCDAINSSLKDLSSELYLFSRPNSRTPNKERTLAIMQMAYEPAFRLLNPVLKANGLSGMPWPIETVINDKTVAEEARKARPGLAFKHIML